MSLSFGHRNLWFGHSNLLFGARYQSLPIPTYRLAMGTSRLPIGTCGLAISTYPRKPYVGATDGANVSGRPSPRPREGNQLYQVASSLHTQSSVSQPKSSAVRGACLAVPRHKDTPTEGAPRPSVRWSLDTHGQRTGGKLALAQDDQAPEGSVQSRRVGVTRPGYTCVIVYTMMVWVRRFPASILWRGLAAPRTGVTTDWQAVCPGPDPWSHRIFRRYTTSLPMSPFALLTSDV